MAISTLLCYQASAAVVPNIPGLDGVQKELLNMVASVQPEVTAQLARIGANIGAWAAINGAGNSADLARLPPHINDQVGTDRVRPAQPTGWSN